MKKTTTLLTIVCALFICTDLCSQDLITFKDGNEKVVKVLEINPTEVKYRTWGVPDGPTYTDLRANIKVITFENGSKEIFNEEAKPAEVILTNQVRPDKQLDKRGSHYSLGGRPISNHQMHQLLLNTKDPEISRYIGLAKEQEKEQYVGFAAIPCAIAGGYFLLSSANGSMSDRQGLSAAGVSAALGMICLTTSITMKIKRSINEDKAVRLYQQKY